MDAITFSATPRGTDQTITVDVSARLAHFQTVPAGRKRRGVRYPLAVLFIGGAMVIVIARVHGKNGLWSQNNGFEYNLVLLVVVVALALLGPGSLSIPSLLS